MTIKTSGVLVLSTLINAALVLSANSAEDKTFATSGWAGSFLVRARIATVMPSDKESFTPTTDTSITNSVIPEVDVSYFLTDNIALETICCATYNKAKLRGGSDVGKAWLVPLTVTAQYHFPMSNGFKPYIGAGPHMLVIASDKAAGPFSSFKLKSPRFGIALQAGADFMLNDRWLVNVDVKKIFVSLKTNVNNGAVVGKAKINPWILGVGIGYKF